MRWSFQNFEKCKKLSCGLFKKTPEVTRSSRDNKTSLFITTKTRKKQPLKETIINCRSSKIHFEKFISKQTYLNNNIQNTSSFWKKVATQTNLTSNNTIQYNTHLNNTINKAQALLIRMFEAFHVNHDLQGEG